MMEDLDCAFDGWPATGEGEGLKSDESKKNREMMDKDELCFLYISLIEFVSFFPLPLITLSFQLRPQAAVGTHKTLEQSSNYPPIKSDLREVVLNEV
jgi:hypothetical protein